MRTFQLIFIGIIIFILSFGQKAQAQFWNETYWGVYYNDKNIGMGTVASYGIKAHISSGDNFNNLKLRQTNSAFNNTTYNIYAQQLSSGTGTKVGVYNQISSSGTGEKIGFLNKIEQGEENEKNTYGLKQSLYINSANSKGIHQEFFPKGRLQNVTGMSTIVHAEDMQEGNIWGYRFDVRLDEPEFFENNYGVIYGSTINIPNKGRGLHVGISANVQGENNRAARFVGNVDITGKLKHIGNMEVNGDVGIGQMPPSGYKLGVAGKIIAEEMVVDLTSSWPDYVFSQDYDLMPLEEVAAFIAEENHLPGIAPAKEIEENGLSVGETQRKMMEKIEELTLYMIELKKENEELKARIDEITK